MAGLAIASRVYPTCALKSADLGQARGLVPSTRCLLHKDVDARHKAGHDDEGSDFNLPI